MRTLIDPALRQAYRETWYTVHADPPFVLQVGQYSQPLADLCQRHDAHCAAYITACNPWSQPLDDATNTGRQAALMDSLSALGLPCIPGTGRHPRGDWPGEPSCLVPGLSLDDARALGLHWQQNAILWADADCVPHLILLR